ncbi:MAG TPA: tetratricopeptide repeat protein [Anaeromyxobacteraceae bacterium]|nr:tetratricopeptide repeat protein [Anaeromyxobacteraceae bacterium]
MPRLAALGAALWLLPAAGLAAPPADLKRAKDRYEFGAYADAAGAVRELLARRKDLPEAEVIEAYRILGLSEYQLGDRPAARSAFINLLSIDPDYSLDPFLVPPPIVEFFDRVKREAEPELAPLRERRRQLKEQERLAEEARRKLLAEEAARSGPPSKVVLVQERIYLFNWLPFGAGQFQNGDTGKGTAIAISQVILGAVNLAAIVAHSEIANNAGRCSSGRDCSNPPYTDQTRSQLHTLDIVKYVSAGLFWGVYAYSVYDAHLHYVPRVETEVTPGSAQVKLSWSF